MAKKMSFADKVSKKKHEVVCQTCNSPIVSTVVIKPMRNPATGGLKFRRTSIGICKCNQKEVLA